MDFETKSDGNCQPVGKNLPCLGKSLGKGAEGLGAPAGFHLMATVLMVHLMSSSLVLAQDSSGVMDSLETPSAVCLEQRPLAGWRLESFSRLRTRWSREVAPLRALMGTPNEARYVAAAAAVFERFQSEMNEPRVRPYFLALVREHEMLTRLSQIWGSADPRIRSVENALKDAWSSWGGGEVRREAEDRILLALKDVEERLYDSRPQGTDDASVRRRLAHESAIGAIREVASFWFYEGPKIQGIREDQWNRARNLGQGIAGAVGTVATTIWAVRGARIAAQLPLPRAIVSAAAAKVQASSHLLYTCAAGAAGAVTLTAVQDALADHWLAQIRAQRWGTSPSCELGTVYEARYGQEWSRYGWAAASGGILGCMAGVARILAPTATPVVFMGALGVNTGYQMYTAAMLDLNVNQQEALAGSLRSLQEAERAAALGQDTRALRHLLRARATARQRNLHLFEAFYSAFVLKSVQTELHAMHGGVRSVLISARRDMRHLIYDPMHRLLLTRQQQHQVLRSTLNQRQASESVGMVASSTDIVPALTLSLLKGFFESASAFGIEEAQAGAQALQGVTTGDIARIMYQMLAPPGAAQAQNPAQGPDRQ